MGISLENEGSGECFTALDVADFDEHKFLKFDKVLVRQGSPWVVQTDDEPLRLKFELELSVSEREPRNKR